ncbi:MAG: TlpA family protein disulfide reductase [Verrucomicrobiota bacterium]|nr:TlpA family protein disulfide reductase [Verrucomicrobiota bacterium]
MTNQKLFTGIRVLAIYQLLLAFLCLAWVVLAGVVVLQGAEAKWDNLVFALLLFVPSGVYGVLNGLRLLLPNRHLFPQWNHLPGASYLLTALSTVAMLYLLVFQTTGTPGTSASAVATTTIAVGKQAPDFSLENHEGQVVSLGASKGKYVLVDFWATGCGPCKEQMPIVARVHQEFRGKGLEVLGISIDEDRQKFLSYVKSKGASYPQLHDPQKDAATSYQVNAIPAIFLIDKEGVIVAKDLAGDRMVETVRREVSRGSAAPALLRGPAR